MEAGREEERGLERTMGDGQRPEGGGGSRCRDARLRAGAGAVHDENGVSSVVLCVSWGEMSAAVAAQVAMCLLRCLPTDLLPHSLTSARVPVAHSYGKKKKARDTQ